MRDIILTQNKHKYTHDASQDDVDAYRVDASAIADDAGNVSTATIIRVTGNVTVSTPSVLSNIITFNVTQTDTNDASFYLKLTHAGGLIRRVLFKINALKNDLLHVGDYGG
jgi:hypothetical protein